MKYQALEEQLDNGRRGSKEAAFGAMKACVEYWAAFEAVNAIVGAFYELGLDSEKMSVEVDAKTDFNVIAVHSDELELLEKDDREFLGDVTEELFEKRMGDLYGIYLDVSFPGAFEGTMWATLDIKGNPTVITAAYRDKASRI